MDIEGLFRDSGEFPFMQAGSRKEIILSAHQQVILTGNRDTQ